VTTGSTPFVLAQHDQGVSTLTLNRPELLNAIGAAMTSQLIDALAAADAEPTTGSIVLTGAGRAFCSGGDVTGMGKGPSVERVLHRDWHLLHALLTTEKPIIAMVNGPAVGIGATLAMSCDIVYVAEDARIGDTHVLLGLVAGDGAIVPLLQNAGPLRTKEFVLRAQLLSGIEAAEAHFVNRAVPSEELADFTYQQAQEISARPTHAVRSVKAVINRYTQWATSEMLEPAIALELHSMRIPEHAKAVERFRARRSARKSERP
jgi:enoyl-CoA hydratase